MKWIGLTGGLGTGKSTVTSKLKQLGIPIVDADELARVVVHKDQPGFQRVVQAFGPGILDESGDLNRRELGQIVFKDKKKLLTLEAILHPLILEEAEKRRNVLAKKGERFAIYDVPLLYEKDLFDRYDATVVVYAKPEQQIERVRQRTSWTDSEIKERMQAQVPIDQKISRANFVIDNSKDEAGLDRELKKFIDWLKAFSK